MTVISDESLLIRLIINNALGAIDFSQNRTICLDFVKVHQKLLCKDLLQIEVKEHINWLLSCERIRAQNHMITKNSVT